MMLRDDVPPPVNCFTIRLTAAIIATVAGLLRQPFLIHVSILELVSCPVTARAVGGGLCGKRLGRYFLSI